MGEMFAGGKVVYTVLGDSLPYCHTSATLLVGCWPDSSNDKRGFSNQLLHKKQSSLHFGGMLLLVFLLKDGLGSNFLFVLVRQIN